MSSTICFACAPTADPHDSAVESIDDLAPAADICAEADLARAWIFNGTPRAITNIVRVFLPAGTVHDFDVVMLMGTTGLVNYASWNNVTIQAVDDGCEIRETGRRYAEQDRICEYTYNSVCSYLDSLESDVSTDGL